MYVIYIYRRNLKLANPRSAVAANQGFVPAQTTPQPREGCRGCGSGKEQGSQKDLGGGGTAVG